MQKCKLFMLLSWVLILTGCIYEAEDYIYKEGENNINVEVSISPNSTRATYIKGNYKFLPNFYTLTRSYSPSNSNLYISSSAEKSIFIYGVKIESSKGTYTDEILYDRLVELSKVNKNSQDNYVVLKLFNDKNTILTNYWNEGNIKVKLEYKNTKNENDSIEFHFDLFKEFRIAMP